VTISNSHATGNVTTVSHSVYVDGDGNYIEGVVDESGQVIDASKIPPNDHGYILSVYRGVAQVGGLLGTAAYVNMTGSYATGDVTAAWGEQIGGLVGVVTGLYPGRSFPNKIADSFATGNVIGGATVGGLVGEIGYLLIDDTNPVKVDNSYATGNVTGRFECQNPTVYACGMIGGLIGSSVRSDISNSFATGNIRTTTNNPMNNMGGLVGGMSYGGSISDSYATGTVIGNGGRDVGGLVGGGGVGISNSYYEDANVVMSREAAPARSEMGGIVDDVRLNESKETQRKIRNSGANGTYSGNRSSLSPYIYQDDESGYSARVTAVSVEEAECGEDDEDCS
jgi:hypothetical protein